jgi:hypothetical protein
MVSSMAPMTRLWVPQGGNAIVHASNVIAINVPGISSVFGDAFNICYIGSIYNEPIGAPGTPHAVFVDADGVLGFNPNALAGESRRSVSERRRDDQMPVSMSLFDAVGSTRLGFVNLRSSRHYKNE